jgi:hypothetical protein
MRRLVLSIALALAAPLAFAATPTNAQIDRLLEVSRTKQVLETSLVRIEAAQEQMVRAKLGDKPLSAQEEQRLSRLLEITRKNLRSTMAWDNLEPKYRKLYAETFDGEDIDALIAFYDSPAGQHFIDRMPVLAQKLMVMLDEILTPMMQGMQADLEKELHSTTPLPPAPEA